MNWTIDGDRSRGPEPMGRPTARASRCESRDRTVPVPSWLIGARRSIARSDPASPPPRDTPPPEGFVSPMTCGCRKQRGRAIWGGRCPAERISFVRNTFSFTTAGPPACLVDTLRRYYGPTLDTFEADDENGRSADLLREPEALFANQNTATEGTAIPATFLRVTVARSSADVRNDRRQQLGRVSRVVMRELSRPSRLFVPVVSAGIRTRSQPCDTRRTRAAPGSYRPSTPGRYNERTRWTRNT
jgi:hypothetical protein